MNSVVASADTSALAAAGEIRPAAAAKAKLSELGKLPLSFERNAGQTAAEVHFIARQQGRTLFFAQSEVVLALQGSRDEARVSNHDSEFKRASFSTTSGAPSILRLRFVGASASATLEATEQLPGKVNYFSGSDRSRWHKDIPTYATLNYRSLYPGVDLYYAGTDRQLKGTYIVAAGADPSRIRWRYNGARKVALDAQGNLQITLARNGKGDAPRLTEHAPVAWQEIEGARTPVAVNYLIRNDGSVGLKLGSYDRTHPLTIDPTLTYSTFFGGSADDPAYKIALDCERNIYIAGYTNSLEFPTKNPIQPNKAAGYDAFVTKLTPDGSAVLWSTYIGGSGAFNNGNDLLQSMTVDLDGNVYLAGNTYSTDYPTVNAYQSSNKGGSDIFLTKIDPTGATLIYSTYLGGNNFSYAFDIAVDATGSAYIAGHTSATTFPIVGGVQSTFGGGCCDAYVTKFAPDGESLIYSTYVGGSDFDEARAIAVDDNGNAYIAGVTASLNFPLANAYQGLIGGNRDAFVTKLNAAGSALIFSTYLGGALDDQCSAMTIDKAGNVYLTGRTMSANFPTAPLGSVFQPAIGSATDAFVSKLSANGSPLLYSTFLGGVQTDYGYGIVVNNAGEAYAVGQTASLNFPQANAIQPYGGGNDAFVTKFNAAGTNVVYSTYLGGGGDEGALSIVRDGLGAVFVTGFTRSTNYPTVNAIQPAYAGGSSDAFISRIFETTPASVALTRAVSRKTHGSAGTFDVDLPLTGDPGIECRSGGANGDYTLVFTFANPLTSVCGASVTSGSGTVSGSAIDSTDAHQYVVTLTGVTNTQVITVSLTNVNDSAGNSSNLVAASMAVLVGDTTADRFVNSADISQTKSRSGQAASGSTFRSDVTTDGFLNSADISLVKSKSGTALP